MAKIESAPVSKWYYFLLSFSVSVTRSLSLPLSLSHTQFLPLLSIPQARQYVEAQPKYVKKDFTQFFVGASPTAVDLLTLLLNMDPDKRPTAEQALQHQYFSQYHMPKDEVRKVTPPLVLKARHLSGSAFCWD